ncbi:hypothetical protein [Eubacterium callanderi]|uniref:hypothetical protein n=1 Tax=Eubacterium callanderi TaxID=53442 RepID=UPI001AA0F5E4|nr:hypothetical protein [Eubacterium callanderi]MBO1702216.1 hypothetical protein [Eubacterium callanderi]
MRKNIGKEGSQSGQFNVMRLAEELKKIDITLIEIAPETGDIYLTFSDELESQVDTICAAHVPIPLELPPSETEILKEQVALLDGALNEVLFTILPEIQGGEI